jgi:hypothetical protein
MCRVTAASVVAEVLDLPTIRDGFDPQLVCDSMDYLPPVAR